MRAWPAIGVEAEDETGDGAGPVKVGRGATTAEAWPPDQIPAPAAEGDGVPASAKGQAKAKPAKPGKDAPAGKPTRRAGAKQAKMIELLNRPGSPRPPDGSIIRSAAPSRAR